MIAYIMRHAVRWRLVRRMASRCRTHGTVCLTYDDGPGPTLTSRLLDLLANQGVKASFYLLGRRVAQAPEVVDRIRSEGHEIGCHTMNHEHAWKVSPARSRDDVRLGYDVLERWDGGRARFRPPYGKLGIGSVSECARRGVAIDWWTVDSGDTRPQPPESEQVVDQVLTRSGGVVLLHDFDRVEDAEFKSRFVLETTEQIITRGRKAGLRFCTVGALMGGEPGPAGSMTRECPSDRAAPTAPRCEQ